MGSPSRRSGILDRASPKHIPRARVPPGCMVRMPRYMYARSIVLLLVGSVLAAAATAPAASADETLGLGDPAAVARRVASWPRAAAPGRAVGLRSTQRLGSGTATTATTDAVAVAGSPETIGAARLPIG